MAAGALWNELPDHLRARGVAEVERDDPCAVPGGIGTGAKHFRVVDRPGAGREIWAPVRVDGRSLEATNLLPVLARCFPEDAQESPSRRAGIERHRDRTGGGSDLTGEAVDV